MFTENTTFILGAGASWHYGYPTGEDLVKDVLEKARALENTLKREENVISTAFPKYISDGAKGEKEQREKLLQTLKDCRTLMTKLVQVNPPVIDYFLGQNKSLQGLGTLLIAWVILRCEGQYLRRVAKAGTRNSNQNRERIHLSDPWAVGKNAPLISKFKDDWYRFILYKIVSGCQTSDDLHKNKVQFVTFNYDVSLEQALFSGLKNIEMFEEKDILEFLKTEGRFVHMYGSIRPDPFADLQPLGDPDNSDIAFLTPILNAAYEASKGIKTIDPDNKHADQRSIESARTAIAEAKDVYILGYGFDQNNNERLGLLNGMKNGRWKRVFFTNFGNWQSVNKRASNGLSGRPEGFLSPASSIGTLERFYYEKSVRNVYEALEGDFDFL